LLLGSLAVVAACAPWEPTPEGSCANRESIAKSLIAAAAADQTARDEPGISGVEAVDRGNGDLLREVFATCGWPDTGRFSPDVSDAAWLLAQHADDDRPLQRSALSLMRSAAAQGLADRGNLAYLEDRVAMGEGLPQSFGTQGGCVGFGRWEESAVSESEGLDARRLAVGLGPMADYRTHMSSHCAGR
jgi:hypothetical protein